MDINPHPPSADPRISFHTGNAREIERIFDDQWLAAQLRPLLVIDDGDHSRQSVRKILEYFGPRMSAGEYLIIEDGSADDLGIAHKLDGGPLKAIREYLASSGPLFRVDRAYCDFYGRNATGNAEGYLCRI